MNPAADAGALVRSKTWATLALALLGVASVAPMAPVAAADIARGAQLYNLHCAGCHGGSGRSINPSAPNLIGGGKTMQPDMALVMRLKTGRNQCPPFLGVLKDQELLDLITYVRTLH